MTVVFTRSHPPYVVGDVATFARSDLEQYRGDYRLYVQGMKMPRSPVRMAVIGDKHFRNVAIR